MARANIAKLLEQRPTETAPEVATSPPDVSDRPAPTLSATSESSRTKMAPAVQKVARVLYKKGAVLYEDQLQELDAQARRLNAAKSTTELPRITANTLLRIAADMLLVRASDLDGDDEAQIRKSLGL